MSLESVLFFRRGGIMPAGVSFLIPRLCLCLILSWYSMSNYSTCTVRNKYTKWRTYNVNINLYEVRIFPGYQDN